MSLNSKQVEVVNRCRQSAIWWMRNFVRVKHQGAGIIPFEPFDYQQKAVKAFRKQRFNIFKKCRQAGASKISGLFSLWFGMFSSHKTILIVSRTDVDAMNFLNENIRLPFRSLPRWMQEEWLPKGCKDNEHALEFANGSKIRSLTSNRDVLRSNASSLNIIDEAGFIPDMDAMWAAGRPTLIHGGSIICISTCAGVGNWYWNTWTDAEAGTNDFNPIEINWWDMNWRIEYHDPLSGRQTVIAPTEGIRECKTKEEKEKYGPYWSPWLETEWRSLQEKNEGWKFYQEILARFIGSGNTILPASVIDHVGVTIDNNYKLVTGPQTYVHPVSGISEIIDFTPDEPDQGLWIWREPVVGTPDKYVGGRIVEKGQPAHLYCAGVDIATGKGKDYSAIEILDLITLEQVAELMIRCLPAIFKKMIDRICRWYNTALTVVERNNGGDDLIDDLQRELMYPRLWRRTEINDRPNKNGKANPISYSHYGHMTSGASKPVLNKYLIDNIRDSEGAGYTIRSRRLYKQFQIYVRKRDRAGRDTGKTEAETGPGNHDDLVMGTALALLGAPDALSYSHEHATPIRSDQVPWSTDNSRRAEELQKKFVDLGGAGMLIPASISTTSSIEESAAEELQRYTQQLGGIPLETIKRGIPIIARNRPRL